MTQDVRDFSVTFDQKVKRSYTLAERQVPLIQERLVKLFIDRISNREVRVRVYGARPNNIDQAFQLAITADRAEIMAGRTEEPMEIGAASVLLPKDTAPLPSPSPDKSQQDFYKSLVASLNRIENQVKQIKTGGKPQQPKQGQNESNPPQQQGRYQPKMIPKFNKPAWNLDGTPNCFRCGQAGHRGFECPQFGDHTKN